MSQEESITTTPSDVLLKTPNKVETLINTLNNTWVTLGLPEVKDDGSIDIPHTPHVMLVDIMSITDRNHDNVKLEDVCILLCHGYRPNIGNKWVFSNDQPVVQTYLDYNGYAKGQTPQLRTVEFIISCNNDLRRFPEVRIGELPSSETVAYAVGEKMKAGAILHEGKIYMRVVTEQDFFGLDQLIESKKIKIIK
jgi:hypothetical protein